MTTSAPNASMIYVKNQTLFVNPNSNQSPNPILHFNSSSHDSCVLGSSDLVCEVLDEPSEVEVPDSHEPRLSVSWLFSGCLLSHSDSDGMLDAGVELWEAANDFASSGVRGRP